MHGRDFERALAGAAKLRTGKDSSAANGGGAFVDGPLANQIAAVIRTAAEAGAHSLKADFSSLLKRQNSSMEKQP